MFLKQSLGLFQPWFGFCCYVDIVGCIPSCYHMCHKIDISNITRGFVFN